MSRTLITIAIALFAFTGGRFGVPAPTTVRGPIDPGESIRPGSPQTAEEIVAHYIDAMGGRDKLQGLNSIYLEGSALLPSGYEISVKTWRVYDRLYRQELHYGGKNIIIIATPSRGWTSNPQNGNEFKPITGEDLKALRVEIDPAGPLADYNNKGFRVENAGTDTVNGEPCYKVKVSCPSNHSITYSICEKDYYVVKEVRRGGMLCGGSLAEDLHVNKGGEVTIEYSDYKKGPGGYVLPYMINVAGLGAPVAIKKYEINSDVNLDALTRVSSR